MLARTTNEKGQDAANVKAPENTTNTAIVGQDDGDRKELARLCAIAARGGFVVHELAHGGFLVGKWGHSREVPSLHALAAALAQMGVR